MYGPEHTIRVCLYIDPERKYAVSVLNVSEMPLFLLFFPEFRIPESIHIDLVDICGTGFVSFVVFLKKRSQFDNSIFLKKIVIYSFSDFILR